MAYEIVAIQHGVDRADGRQVRARELPPKLFPDLRRAPAWIFSLQAHDRGFKRRRQPIRLPVRAVAPIAEGLGPAVFVAVEDLVARLARNPELRAQRRHLLALEQAGDKPESLVHDVTLLPRHAPSCGGKVSPMRSEYAVTYGSGRTKEFASFDRNEISRRTQIEKSDRFRECAPHSAHSVSPSVSIDLTMVMWNE
jgi:hypothetical protein